MSKSIKTFWNNSHDKKVLSFLSGCQYDETIDFLKLRSYMVPGNHVLEMGAGLGYVTKGLYENNLVVSVLDISETALERVKDYCERVFTTNELEKLPSDYFDVIICHNLIQHIPTDFLIEELRHCIRSLKASGVFAMEFVSNDKVEDTWNVQYKHNSGLPNFCRTPKYLENIINKLAGECKLMVDNKCDIGITKGCHVFHIKRISV